MSKSQGGCMSRSYMRLCKWLKIKWPKTAFVVIKTSLIIFAISRDSAIYEGGRGYFRETWTVQLNATNWRGPPYGPYDTSGLFSSTNTVSVNYFHRFPRMNRLIAFSYGPRNVRGMMATWRKTTKFITKPNAARRLRNFEFSRTG